MPGVQQFMTLENGRDTLKTPTVQSTGAAQGGTVPALGADGKLDLSLFPTSVVADNLKVMPAFEAIGAGKFVNIFVDAGVFKARLADNSLDRRAMGFVRDAVVKDANAMIFFETDNTGQTGLTAGRVYLGTGGGVTQTPPTKAGGAVISQFLGNALSATEIDVQVADEIVL